MPLSGNQVAIAIDQLVNTLMGGMADETISARLWRNRNRSWWWSFCYYLVNAIFFDRSHCFNSWMAEVNRKQLPGDYIKKG